MKNPYHGGNFRGDIQHNNGSASASKSVAFLRWTFVGLSVACFVQISYQQHLRVSSGYYGDLSQSPLRNSAGADPDVPVRGNARSIYKNDGSATKNLPPIPRFVVDPLFKAEQDRIDSAADEETRCKQYGVPPLPRDSKSRQRRIFFGSMLANENPEVIVAHALEAYNKYDVVALVESNTTHFATPRTMNFGPGSISVRTLQESELFGFRNTTKVVVDYWLEDEPDLKMMSREVEQRNTIWKIWLKEGMAPWDVGIMADLDEVTSRDFLNALRVCDFPKLRYDADHRPSCQTPKMALSTMQFESTPLCVKEWEWFHPDLIAGHCILGVGDPQGRATPERDTTVGGDRRIPAGNRKGWGSNDYKKYPEDVLSNDRFPLWDGRDIREINGNEDNLVNFDRPFREGMGDTAVYGTAYHLHNWFKDLTVLRHKYATYGHANPDAGKKTLSNIQGDLDMLVRCTRGLGNNPALEIGKLPDDGYPYYTSNRLLSLEESQKRREVGSNDSAIRTNANHMFSLGGNRPIFFQNRTYVLERHALVQKLIRDDEQRFGSLYKDPHNK